MARNGFSIAMIVVLAALLPQPALFCQKRADSIDKSLAEVYLDRAEASHQAGEDGQALSLLQESLSLYGQSPDALYLMAVVDSPALSPDYSLRVSKASRLEAALALGGFARFKREDAVQALAECLVRIREYDRAAKAVKGAVSHPELDPRFALILEQCDFFAGRREAYRSAMADSLRRFPDDPRFADFFLGHADAKAASAQDRPLVSAIARRLEALYERDPAILVEILPFTELKADRLSLLRRYRSSGKGGRRSVIEAQRYGVEAEDGLIDEFWQGMGENSQPSWDELREFFDLLGSQAGRKKFLERLGGYTGQILRDESGDGVPESRTSFKEGEPSDWEYDPDQDGQIDVSIRFKDGLPDQAICLQDGKDAVFVFATYPGLRSAAYEKDGKTSALDFGAMGASLPLVSLTLPFRAEGMNRLREARRDGQVAIPTFDAALPMAVSLEEKTVELSAQGGLPHERRTVTDLSGGSPLMSREYLDGKLSLEREYDRGIPTQERFDYDETGGFWAGRAVYERTKEAPYYRKSYLTIDADGDGLPEYRESYYPVLRKEWDFDGNGSYDVAEETRAGAVSDFFSSKLDGVFDVRVDLKAGRIVAVTRNGKEYRVSKESKADIYWIGRMPFELGSAAPKNDGVYEKSGVKYLFYRSEKIAFAELLP